MLALFQRYENEEFEFMPTPKLTFKAKWRDLIQTESKPATMQSPTIPSFIGFSGRLGILFTCLFRVDETDQLTDSLKTLCYEILNWQYMRWETPVQSLDDFRGFSESEFKQDKEFLYSNDLLLNKSKI